MNIYIYGNNSFKKEIYETLEHSNIKFKLDDNCLIKDIDNLSELKRTIQNNPNDIYLIDDEKIIKKNSLNKKIKFLTPKDGIEEEFLLDNGIADLSINSLSEIPKYILRKHEEEKHANLNVKDSINNEDELVNSKEYEKEDSLELDDELAQLLAKEEPSVQKETEKQSFDDENLEDLFNMSDDINLGEPEDIFASLENFEDKSSDVSKNEFDDIMNFNDNFGLNNISFDYDDEDITKDIQEKEDFSDMEFNELEDENEVFENLNFLDEIFSNEKKEKIQVIDKIDKLEKKEKIEVIEEKKSIENINTNESLPGDNMNNDEFFELDSLNEKDLLEALNYTDNKREHKEQALSVKTDSVEKNTTSLNISSGSSVDELAQLISKLLSNKTLEITIKIKD